ncbi:MAG: hypothetical protein C0404_04985 [Verrucomicrobia bacterium]|nr:hypothetical protein [Verrucomicrobiota bacterium]
MCDGDMIQEKLTIHGGGDRVDGVVKSLEKPGEDAVANAGSETLMMFVTESREHLGQCEADLLALEDSATPSDLINRIFRAVHSIKGGAGMFGLSTISKLSHTMETVMSRVRDGEIKPSREMIDALLSGGDKLRAMIDDVDHSRDVDISGDLALLKPFILEKAASGGAVPPAAPAKEAAKEESDPGAGTPFEIGVDLAASCVAHGRCIYTLTIRPDKDLVEKDCEPADYVHRVKSLGTILSTSIAFDDDAEVAKCLSENVPLKIVFSTVLELGLVSVGLEVDECQIQHVSLDELRKMKITGEEPVDVQSVAVRRQTDTALEQGSAKPGAVIRASPVKPEETIRVPVSLLDDLMNLAGEMVLGRNQLLRLSPALAAAGGGIGAILQNINMVTSELQEKVMQTRLQQIGSVFSKLVRVVRDLSKRLGKNIRLDLDGEEVELDKSIIEMLSDPLMHLVRNSADHGIESPDERRRAGKPVEGVIGLSARHEGGQVHIEITDDGRGISGAVLKEKAVAKGLLSLERVKQLSDREALSLVFIPGFSTAEVVNDVSGRGVGMDVVKSNMDRLGGNIHIESEVGRGTRTILRLPLTLAIVPALVVVAADRRFALPQMNLEEVLRLGRGMDIEKVRGHDVVRLRGALLPLVSLDHVTGSGSEPGGDAYVLVVRDRHRRFGLVVDRVLDTEEIVVKPLSSYLKAARCYSGATIMGDGKLALILDVPGIADLAGMALKDIEQEVSVLRETAVMQSEPQSVLLFRSGGHELFGVHLELLARVEKIRADRLERIGDKEFVKYRDHSMRVLRLHDHLPVSRPAKNPELIYVIVPKFRDRPLGIVAEGIKDVVEAQVVLQRDTVRAPGILGSAVINEDLVVFLDIYGLFEKAEPDLYDWSGSRASDRLLAGKRILLADDTDFFRTIESGYLTAFGCLVDVVADGQSAWERLNSRSYDLLITDLEMPVMGGMELLRRMRDSEKLKRIPVVAMTRIESRRLPRVAGENAGFDAYETKLDRERLRYTISEILQKSADPETRLIGNP